MNILYKAGNRSGYVNHYYHFLFGYLLPVLSDINWKDDYIQHNNNYMIDCGPMNNILKELGFLIHSASNLKMDGHRRIRGFDTPRRIIPEATMSKAIEQINILLPTKRVDTYDFLLIDRGPTPTKKQRIAFQKLKRKDLRGNQRRSITNMDEIENLLLKFSKKVQRHRLENLNLRDQIKIFKGAKYIIGQHGAAMSNLCFAERCEHVIELQTERNKNFFNNIAEYMKINKINFNLPRGRHVEADCKLLKKEIINIYE